VEFILFAFLGKAASTLLFGSMDKPAERRIKLSTADLAEV